MTIETSYPAAQVIGKHRKPYALGLIALAVFSVAMALPALAESGHFSHHRHSEAGGGGGGGAWGANPERIERMLSMVSASQPQREQIRQILKNASSDQAAQREAHRTLRLQAMAVFTAPVVDANAAEKIRQQMLTQHDQASQRMMAVMLEVSSVLTAEQRAQLAAHKQRREQSRKNQQTQ